MGSIEIKYTTLLFSQLLIIASSCNLLDKEEQIPAFISISNMQMDTKISEGTENQNFQDAWIYVDGTLLGIMEVPGELPVLDSGVHEVSIFPGVRLNGISSTPDIYYACAREDFNVELNPAESAVINPVFKYSSKVDFLMIEDFESNLQFTDDLDGNAETNIQRVQNGALEGNFSGKISLDSTNNFLEVGSTLRFDDIPFNVAEVYLELHFKNEIDFSIGLQSINEGFPPSNRYLVGFRPSLEWKKVYVSFTDLIRESGSDSYKIIFQAANFDSDDEKSIFLDNIKLLMLN